MHDGVLSSTQKLGKIKILCEPNDAQRTLGSFIAPDGSITRQLEVPVRSSDRMAALFGPN